MSCKQNALAHFARFGMLVIAWIGALLRVVRIGDKGLWLDEAFSIWMARQPLTEMWAWLVQIDQHPPLYYTLLHFWLALGDEQVTVRLFSAWCSMLTIPLIFWLGKKLVGDRVGLAAALILAFSPFHIQFAQETRMYALLTLNASLAMAALIYLFQDPNALRTPIGSQLRNWRWPHGGLAAIQTDLAWLTYIVFTAAMMLTHNTAILFFLTINGLVLSLTLIRHRFGDQSINADRRAFRPPSLPNWLLAQAGVIVLWSPWLRPFLIQSRRVYVEFWIPTPTVARVAAALRTFASAFWPDRVGVGHAVWVLFAALLGLGIWRLRKQPALLALLLVLAIAPFVDELLVSLKRPIFYDRTLIWTTLPLYLILATGIDQCGNLLLPVCRANDRKPRLTDANKAADQAPLFQPRHTVRWPLSVCAAIAVVAVNGFSLCEYYLHFQKEQWDAAAAYVAEHMQEGDLLLFNATWVQIPFDYYLDRLGKTAEERGMPVDLFERGILEPKMTESDLPYLRTLIHGRERVWLIYSHNWYTDPQNLIPSALEGELGLLSKQAFYGLEVHLYGVD